jgi:hypothetical protein
LLVYLLIRLFVDLFVWFENGVPNAFCSIVDAVEQFGERVGRGDDWHVKVCFVEFFA